MKLYPSSAVVQLEFDKVIHLLQQYIRTNYALGKLKTMRTSTDKPVIERLLSEVWEYKLIMKAGLYLPNDFTIDIQKEIKILGIPGATLVGEELLKIRSLAGNAGAIFEWFDAEKQNSYPYLAAKLEGKFYTPEIIRLIDGIIDDLGKVHDKASNELFDIRMELHSKRVYARRTFEKIQNRYNKLGYSADVSESFSNGRRVLAIMSEYKRQVRGIIHGESETRRTTYVEPEEMLEINNQLFLLEDAEKREERILLHGLTKQLSVYEPQIKQYYVISGEYDFIRAKAKLAIDMQANMPQISNHAEIDLIKAHHPLLFIYNQANGKKTIPLTLTLNKESRIIVISGPNAGGKTVAMKTIGLMQLMLQSGLLVPVSGNSTIGIFKNLFVHIGDTQSIEFELSTYSSHLQHMKHFIEDANGKTLFFIDELGSGTDPNLGGAFAEAILEELSHRQAIGIVTTHYLNLKVMANHTKGIKNAAMAFDEATLLPQYQLLIGKPGSSYTFAIAQRIGLPIHLINRAKKLAESDHFKLENLLTKAEADLGAITKQKKELEKTLKENEQLKFEMRDVMDKERQRQTIEVLKHKNKLSEDRIVYLKDMESKFRQIVHAYRKADDKNAVIKTLQNLLFQQTEKKIINKKIGQIDDRYREIGKPIEKGVLVKLRLNYKVGTVTEIRGKRAIVQVGVVPMSVMLDDLIAVEENKEKKDNS